MKKKSERLKIVLDQASRKEQVALDHLSKRRKYFDAQNAQLSSLKEYHSQYLADMKASSGVAQSVFSLQSKLQFLTQVDAAILQQEGVVKLAEKEFQSALENWTSFHQKRKGMADLIDQYKKDEDAIADKQVQRQIESDLQSRFYKK